MTSPPSLSALLLVLQNLARRGQLAGTVKLIFQPAEEGRGGAKLILDAGPLNRVSSVFGLHVWPHLSAGTVATRRGAIMAGSDRFTLHLHATGGHAAIPHATADPVLAGAAVITALQPLVSRETSPTDAVVVTVSRFNTGEGAPNVIPSHVRLAGTVRALTLPHQIRLRRRITEVVDHVVAMTPGLTVAWEWSPLPYPPTVNDGQLTEAFMGGKGGMCEDWGRCEWLEEPTMAAEDFSFYGQGGRVPTLFTFLGIGDEERGTDAGLHTPTFKLDERQLSLGVAMHVRGALLML